MDSFWERVTLTRGDFLLARFGCFIYGYGAALCGTVRQIIGAASHFVNAFPYLRRRELHIVYLDPVPGDDLTLRFH